MKMIDQFKWGVETMYGKLLNDEQRNAACEVLADLSEKLRPNPFAETVHSFGTDLNSDRAKDVVLADRKFKSVKRLEPALRQDQMVVICRGVVTLGGKTTIRELRTLILPELASIDQRSRSGARTDIGDRVVEAMRNGYLREITRVNFRDEAGKIKRTANLCLDDPFEITESGQTLARESSLVPLAQAAHGNGHMQSMSGNDSGEGNARDNGNTSLPLNGSANGSNTNPQSVLNSVFAGQ
jgi:hypothetical protein